MVGHDTLCCHFQSYGTPILRPYRSCYVDDENLVKDHALNPKYICPKCAREIRNFQKLRVSKDKFKKQKCDKKFIPRLAPSETDCEPSKCSHSKYNIGVLKNIWLSLDLKLQCLFFKSHNIILYAQCIFEI